VELLSIGTNAKTIKSDALGVYLTAIQYLSPHKISGKNFCPNASNGCIATCLNTAGRGAMHVVQKSRLRKSQLFINDRNIYKTDLLNDLSFFVKKCKNEEVLPAVRLNGTSDLNWENIFPEIFTKFPEIQFYDYTKQKRRYKDFLEGNFPKNYHLTFSRSEINEGDCLDFLKNYKKAQIAVVFEKIPKKWKGFSVKSGDDNDLRFLDDKRICGLIAKGRAKKDKTGFVVR
jgi:hypothetical protein